MKRVFQRKSAQGGGSILISDFAEIDLIEGIGIDKFVSQIFVPISSLECKDRDDRT